MSRVNDKSFNAVKAIEKLLKEIQANSGRDDFSDVPLEALKHQSKLSKLILPARGLTGVSLNTVKRVAEDHIRGGFIHLDAIRKDAYRLLELHRRVAGAAGRDTKESLRGQVQEKGLVLDMRQEDLMHLTSALLAAMAYMKEFAETSRDPAVIARLPQALRDVRGRASPASNFLSLVKK